MDWDGDGRPGYCSVMDAYQPIQHTCARSVCTYISGTGSHMPGGLQVASGRWQKWRASQSALLRQLMIIGEREGASQGQSSGACGHMVRGRGAPHRVRMHPYQTTTQTHPTRAATAPPQKQASRPSTTAAVAAAAALLPPRRRRDPAAAVVVMLIDALVG